MQMKVKTSEASGVVLDWMVAKCELRAWAVYNEHDTKPARPSEFLCDCEFGPGFSPSTDWALGGPIIERERMLVEPHSVDQWCATYKCPDDVYDGPTPLIAAMRCYVASELGDEVEVPDELAS
jgi:hypothetical protein